jgi:hypothetical protein
MSDAVRRVIADIDGDGEAGLDPEALVDRGLPRAFVERFVEEHRAADLTLFVEVAGPDTRLRSVWSLSLLRGLVAHYGLDPTEPFMGQSRNARVSERLLDHLATGDES